MIFPDSFCFPSRTTCTWPLSFLWTSRFDRDNSVISIWSCKLPRNSLKSLSISMKRLLQKEYNGDLQPVMHWITLQLDCQDLQGHCPQKGIYSGQVCQCQSTGMCQVCSSCQRGTLVSSRKAIHLYSQAARLDSIRRGGVGRVSTLCRWTRIDSQL